MRYERNQDRERQVDNEPAVRGPVAQEEEAHDHRGSNHDENDASTTRRGSSSERSER